MVVLLYTSPMYIAILGRQPNLSLAELERLYGSEAVQPFGDHAARITTDQLNIQTLGGTVKAGRIVGEFTGTWPDISRKLVSYYLQLWRGHTGKITLGLSGYGHVATAAQLQKTGLVLKQKLRQRGTSLRLIPNKEAALSSAVSHHNKLGLSEHKVELLIVRHGATTIIAESTGAQNITDLAARDQQRPRRDARVGMLPPKLAQIIINLAAGQRTPQPEPAPWLLDPFCGTGVLLQEAALLGYNVQGTDIEPRMIAYSQENLDWLFAKKRLTREVALAVGDATTFTWNQPIDLVACETYLGQPFSAIPSEQKRKVVQKTCNTIISNFLKNLHPQLQPGTTLCIAIPAWRRSFTDHVPYFYQLPLVHHLQELGYEQIPLQHTDTTHLMYARDNQVVARQLFLLRPQR